MWRRPRPSAQRPAARAAPAAAGAPSPFIERDLRDTDKVHNKKRQIEANKIMAGCIGSAEAKRQKSGRRPEEDGSYELEGIVDSKMFPISLQSRVPRVMKFRVRFVGYGPLHDEWMREEDLEDARELLTDYRQKEKIRLLENENLGLYERLGETLGKLENAMEQNSRLRIKLGKVAAAAATPA